MLAKFIGFLVFLVFATMAFFVPIALGVAAPFALKPKKDEKEKEESED